MPARADHFELVEYSVDYIEKHLTRELNREDIAKRIGMSKYHFQRVFKSIVGESTRDYLSKRRLTDAAQQLLYTDNRILDIALSYGYGSHEAFSRAFKARFGVTPGEYREKGEPLIIERPRLTSDTLENLQTGLTLEPDIVEQAETTIVGLKNPCILPFNDNQLLNVWNQFIPRICELHDKAKTPLFIGIYEYLPSTGGFYNTEYCYMAGVPKDSVSTIPAGMVTKTIPAAKYAMFRRKDSTLTRLEIHRYIHGTWLPNSNYERRADLDILVVFADSPASAEYDIFIPIK